MSRTKAMFEDHIERMGYEPECEWPSQEEMELSARDTEYEQYLNSHSQPVTSADLDKMYSYFNQ